MRERMSLPRASEISGERVRMHWSMVKVWFAKLRYAARYMERVSL